MEGFLQASLSGDMEALLELFSDDVTLYSDGGGKTRAALRPVYGADNVARFLTGILRNILPGFAVKQTRVNGRSGLVGYFGDGSPHSVAVKIAVEENRAYFRTWDTAWKLRRIHNNPEVHFAPSTARGKPTAPPIKARARVLDAQEGCSPVSILLCTASLSHWSIASGVTRPCTSS
jgi:PPOX class probable F420-dependent enzyme